MIFSTQNTSPLEMGWTLCRGARCEVGLGFVVRSSLHHHATSPGLTNIQASFRPAGQLWLPWRLSLGCSPARPTFRLHTRPALAPQRTSRGSRDTSAPLLPAQLAADPGWINRIAAVVIGVIRRLLRAPAGSRSSSALPIALLPPLYSYAT